MDLSALIFAALKKANTANERIDNLPLPMVFKGTLGTGGTISTLPTASSENEGYVYIVISDGTYAGQSAKAGDTFVSDGSSWVLVPSADEPSPIDDSVTSTALTWSSDKINTEFNGVKVKTISWNGNGQAEKVITFPDTPKVILCIGNNKDNTLVTSAPISYNFNKFIFGFMRTANGTNITFSSALTYSGNQMTIAGSEASRSFNYNNEDYMLCYI